MLKSFLLQPLKHTQVHRGDSPLLALKKPGQCTLAGKEGSAHRVSAWSGCFSVKFPAARWTSLSRQIRPSERSSDLSKGSVVFPSWQTKEPMRFATQTNSLTSLSAKNSSCPANHASIALPSVAYLVLFSSLMPGMQKNSGDILKRNKKQPHDKCRFCFHCLPLALKHHAVGIRKPAADQRPGDAIKG